MTRSNDNYDRVKNNFDPVIRGKAGLRLYPPLIMPFRIFPPMPATPLA
jgi:hypothetical protein